MFEWLPNLHPLVVHFPIAFLFLALLLDAIKFFFKEKDWIEKTVFFLYLAGTIGLIAAYFTGKEAIETVRLRDEAATVAARHEDLALYTLIFFVIFIGIKVFFLRKRWEKKPIVSIGMMILTFLGIILLAFTSDLGGQLVFRHGVAVKEVDLLNERIQLLEKEVLKFVTEARPKSTNGKSWRWKMSPGADKILFEDFTIIGNREFTANTVIDESNESFLTITISNSEIGHIVFGEKIERVEGQVLLNIDQFDGEIKLVHHFSNSFNYQYLSLDSGHISQGQVINGKNHVLQKISISPRGWIKLRVIASGRHFYGYKDGQNITHTHADEMEPGKTGISFQGKGGLKLRLIEFKSIN